MEVTIKNFLVRELSSNFQLPGRHWSELVLGKGIRKELQLFCKG